MALGLDTPMLIILIGVLGGTVSYGITGLFLGPIVLAVIWELLVAWTRSAKALRPHLGSSAYGAFGNEPSRSQYRTDTPEELQGGPEGNIIPTLQEQKICSSRRHDCEQDPLKQLRKAQVPKLHSHLAVLAPLFHEGFSTCPARHLRNVDEERESGPFATR